MYTLNLPTKGKSNKHATETLALNYASNRGAKRWSDVEQFIRTVWEYGNASGIRPEVVFGQWCDETDVGKSAYWLNNLNPGGLRITYPGQPSKTWNNGRIAALAMLNRLSLYIYGYIRPGLEEGTYENPLPEEVGKAGYFGIAQKLNDLSGRWAQNPNYGKQIVNHLNYAFPNGDDVSLSEDNSMSYQFGNVVHPPYVDRYIPNSQTSAWDDLGQRNPVGVCQHSMVGTLMGTDGWFRRGTASTGLTDYGIGGSTDGSYDGAIFKWNDPLGRRSGWANGSTDGLEGDGPLFVRTYGINAINRDLVSIERSDGGNIATPMSDRQFASICNLTAYWFDYINVPWDSFPLNPASGAVTHLLHKEIATKDCPFPAVYNRFDEIQNRVRAILKAGQVPEITDQPSIPPTGPIVTDPGAYPNGWTEEGLADRWGTIPRYEPAGGIGSFSFNPKHAVCNAWIARGVEEDRTRLIDLPRPYAWHRIRVDEHRVSDLVLFVGQSAWALYRPDVNVRWVWAN